MVSKRFLIVPVLSSAARMPLPLATIAFATRASSVGFIASSLRRDGLPHDGVYTGTASKPPVNKQHPAKRAPRIANRTKARPQPAPPTGRVGGPSPAVPLRLGSPANQY